MNEHEAHRPDEHPAASPQDGGVLPHVHEAVPSEALPLPPHKSEPVVEPATADEPVAQDMTGMQDVPTSAEPEVHAATQVPEPAKDPRSLPSTLTAARDAAAFVAQIFADTQAEKAESVLVVDTTASETDAVQADGDAPLEGADAPFAPLAGQHILILGMGASGLAMARWCARTGAASITVADTRAAPPQLAALQQELPHARFVSGSFSAALVDGQTLHAVYRSPGLSPEEIAPVLGAARAIGIYVGGELSLYSMALQALRSRQGYAPAVLAITGTNGKTTVTSLTG
ncbi:MAG: UDP-N-acetylmuramoyl-L-alanine--D-glutamate ligase, partial [Burkholderiaceae bacterium]|nr:UDP-N-acetylmuramoyl-L-alanine--D-glutamate ligase [Burkholderiaceae bacterium]